MDGYYSLSPISLLHRIKDSFHFAVSALLANLFSALFTFFFALGSFFSSHSSSSISVINLCDPLRNSFVSAITIWKWVWLVLFCLVLFSWDFAWSIDRGFDRPRNRERFHQRCRRWCYLWRCLLHRSLWIFPPPLAIRWVWNWMPSLPGNNHHHPFFTFISLCSNAFPILSFM